MNKECKAAFDKANELINRNKIKFGEDIVPEVQSFDYGNIHVQYFIDWVDLLDESKVRKIFNNNDEKIKDISLYFTKKDNNIRLFKFDHDETYIILNGEIVFNFDDNSTKRLSTYESYTISKGIKYNISTIRDTYVLIIKH